MGNTTSSQQFDQAIQDLKNGKFIIIYDSDDREGEADFVIASEHASPTALRTMRKDGGGLIFLMTDYQTAQHLQIPFLQDLFNDISTQYPVFNHLTPNDIPYDDRSSFSIYINHRETFTGITDNDRSLTMKEFSKLLDDIKVMTSNKASETFGQRFRTPGHIPICVAAEHLLDDRQGHTELVVSMLKMAGLKPAGSGCEIMGDDGNALSKEEIHKYANDHDLTVLNGEDIISAWKTWQQK